jgi:hypothetical protein
MSQKSSLPQSTKSVPKALTSNRRTKKILGTLTGIIEIAPGNQSAANEAVASTTAALQGRTSVPIIIKGELKVDKESAAGTSSR